MEMKKHREKPLFVSFSKTYCTLCHIKHHFRSYYYTIKAKRISETNDSKIAMNNYTVSRVFWGGKVMITCSTVCRSFGKISSLEALTSAL